MAVEPLSTYLDDLLGQVDRAAARLAGADVVALVAGARDEQARLSARLDGSPLSDETTPSWAAALRLDQAPSQDVAALELANLLSCHDQEPGLAGRFLAEPLDVLREVHRVVVAGLVSAPGELRGSAQAVHDGAQGRVIYNAPDPSAVPGLLEGLVAWIREHAASAHPLVIAGTVHERLLEWHPFEAANGRVARIAARLVLRATGVDSHGVAVPERWLAADPGGYYGEVAATIRRRGDLGPWLERYGEALVAALEAAADTAHGAQPDVPERARALVDALGPGDTVTVADHAEQTGVSVDDARVDLRLLARAGLLRLDPGTRGLRFRRPAVYFGGVSTDPSIS